MTSFWLVKIIYYLFDTEELILCLCIYGDDVVVKPVHSTRIFWLAVFKTMSFWLMEMIYYLFDTEELIFYLCTYRDDAVVKLVHSRGIRFFTRKIYFSEICLTSPFSLSFVPLKDLVSRILLDASSIYPSNAYNDNH